MLLSLSLSLSVCLSFFVLCASLIKFAFSKVSSVSKSCASDRVCYRSIWLCPFLYPPKWVFLFWFQTLFDHNHLYWSILVRSTLTLFILVACVSCLIIFLCQVSSLSSTCPRCSPLVRWVSFFLPTRNVLSKFIRNQSSHSVLHCCLCILDLISFESHKDKERKRKRERSDDIVRTHMQYNSVHMEIITTTSWWRRRRRCCRCWYCCWCKFLISTVIGFDVVCHNVILFCYFYNLLKLVAFVFIVVITLFTSNRTTPIEKILDLDLTKCT